jgi:hypothetical protein
MAMLPDEARQPLRQQWRRSPLVRRALAIAGVILLLGGFVWLWWQGVPALYRDTPNVNDAERLKATTDTRTALLAGLVGIGALGPAEASAAWSEPGIRSLPFRAGAAPLIRIPG